MRNILNEGSLPRVPTCFVFMQVGVSALHSGTIFASISAEYFICGEIVPRQRSRASTKGRTKRIM